MNKTFLPFALPSISEDEINEVTDSLRSGWLTSGPKTKRFEEAFSKYIGSKHAIAVNSATAGLHLALESIGIKQGDKIITSPYTFTATAEVARYFGADPVFADINPDTFNIDPQNIIDAIKKHKSVKAIIPVHFAGQPCDMDNISQIAIENNLSVIDDAAHALPTTYNNKKVGTLSDISVFSFYATKTLATGEGGMVTTDNDKYAERIKTMRLHGINSDVFDRYRSQKPSWYYEVVAPGFKYNMTDIAASLGIHQLAKCDHFQNRRKYIAERYNDAFIDLPLNIPFINNPSDTHAWHLYVIKLELERLSINRNQFIDLMHDAGVGTSVHFIPLHIHPYWRIRYGFHEKDFPESYDVFQRVVSLPIYPKMTDSDIDRVIDATTHILNSHLL